jgi:hypothetical protein
MLHYMQVCTFSPFSLRKKIAIYKIIINARLYFIRQTLM